MCYLSCIHPPSGHTCGINFKILHRFVLKLSHSEHLQETWPLTLTLSSTSLGFKLVWFHSSWIYVIAFKILDDLLLELSYSWDFQSWPWSYRIHPRPSVTLPSVYNHPELFYGRGVKFTFKHDKKKTHFYKSFFFFCNSKINNIICDWKLFSGIIVYLKQCKNALKKLNLNYSFFCVYLASNQRALSSCIARAIVKLMLSFSPISVI